jgi:ubiquitin carboxyl-terminal hydrolase 4/11/15
MNVACNVTNGEFVTTRKAEPLSQEENSSAKTISLHDCMMRFLSAEVLSDTDAWYCSGCKHHVQAEKQIGLWKLPPVLVIHLKRFAFLSNRYREKLEDLVQFPLVDLNMSQYLLSGAEGSSSAMYNLFAVSNHMGGLGGGHYTAFARPSKEWWLLNDESTSLVQDPAKIVSPNSYILFYSRKQ